MKTTTGNTAAPFTVAVLTISDTAHTGKREDASGPVARSLMAERGYHVVFSAVLPDEADVISAELRRLCDEEIADLVLTTGGTGFSPRDVTPEATLAVAERLCPGIPEAMRARSLAVTDRAMLSRSVAGIRRQTLIINLPGSPKAVTECLGYILEAVGHGLSILTGRDGECARL